MIKVYEIWLYDECIDAVYCQNESEANHLAEEIYPDYPITVQKKKTE